MVDIFRDRLILSSSFLFSIFINKNIKMLKHFYSYLFNFWFYFIFSFINCILKLTLMNPICDVDVCLSILTVCLFVCGLNINEMSYSAISLLLRLKERTVALLEIRLFKISLALVHFHFFVCSLLQLFLTIYINLIYYAFCIVHRYNYLIKIFVVDFLAFFFSHSKIKN